MTANHHSQNQEQPAKATKTEKEFGATKETLAQQKLRKNHISLDPRENKFPH